MSKGYEPTEAEAERIDRAGLVAAWKELQLLRNDDIEVSAGVLACLRAFKSAWQASWDEKQKLLMENPDYEYISHFSNETTNFVCSALHGLDMEPDELSPNSIGGGRISILFQAAKALEAMSAVYSAFDDDDGVFGIYLAEETTALAEAAMKRHNS